MENRFGLLRTKVIEHLCAFTNGQEHQASQHLYAVSLLCGLIGKKRGLDADLCKCAGLLHDLWLYRQLPLAVGEHAKHAEYGSHLAREILTGIEAYSVTEVETICSMIFNHNDKHLVHSDYDEALKDADALTHYLNDSAYDRRYGYNERHFKVMSELGLNQP